MTRRERLSETDREEVAQMKKLLPNIGDELIRHSIVSIIEKLQRYGKVVISQCGRIKADAL